MLYSFEAIDQRIALRHEKGVNGSLRKWARAVESSERVRTGGATAIVVGHEGYRAAVMRCSLALTQAATIEEIDAMVSDDWARDCAGKPTISFERFKDAMFQI